MEILTYLIIAGYAICVVQAVYSLTTKKAVLGNFALIAFGVGFACQSVWLVHRGITNGRCPLVGTQETTAFLSWSLAVAYMVAQRWYKTAALKAFVFPLIFLLATIAAIVPGVPGTPASIQEPLPRLLLPVHVGLIMLAYSAFFISFGAGLMYIVQERELKLKRFGTVFQKLPSLDTCDAISFKSIAVGFVLLTLGVAAGIVWSHARDGIYWHGQPIEIFSVLTWVIYLVIIQSRLSAGWGGRNAALATIIGFVMVICSLAGLRYLGTLHLFG